MSRLTPTAQELQEHCDSILLRCDPADRAIWVGHPCTAALYSVIERLRMECLEQAEECLDRETTFMMSAQAQILRVLAEELETTITEVIEDDDDEQDDDSAGRAPPRRRADYTP